MLRHGTGIGEESLQNLSKGGALSWSTESGNQFLNALPTDRGPERNGKGAVRLTGYFLSWERWY